jgi:lipopolysaccharide/colanic/teichoic acid biosynthesis glycosyltransferase
MPQCRTGTSNRHAMTPDAVGLANDHSSATRASSWRSSAPGFGKLQIVQVDRWSRDRIDMDSYGPFLARERRAYPIFKRVFDLVGASVAILLLSPLVLAIVICICASGGSPFFRHRRVGQSGVFFDCFKFRTMVTNSDELLRNLLEGDSRIKQEWLQDHKLKDDPRVTVIGRFLRKASLDELPQLWNVLRGDMSLVGPRPVVPSELPRYGRKVALFLSTRPGITGLWQISGRNNTDYRRRVALDVCYVRSRSVILDVYILVKTLPAVFTTSGAY